MPPQEYSWDDELNRALIDHRFRAVSAENETIRFALVLRDAFRRVERSFGQGYFNAVLVDFVRNGPLSGFPDVANVLADVVALPPERDSASFDKCRTAIEQVLRAAAMKLTQDLSYEREQAESILAGAVAIYVDERF